MIHFDLKALVRFKQAVTLNTGKKVSAAWAAYLLLVHLV